MHSLSNALLVWALGFFMGAFAICAAALYLEKKMELSRRNDAFLSRVFGPNPDEVYDQEKDPPFTVLKY